MITTTRVDQFLEGIADDVAPLFERYGWTYGMNPERPATRDEILYFLRYLYKNAAEEPGSRHSTGRVFVEVDEYGHVEAGLSYNFFGDNDDDEV